MSRLRILPLLLLLLVTAACTAQEAEFVANEQVAAEDRTEEVAAPAPGAGGGGGAAVEFVAVDIAFEQAPTSAPAGDVTIGLNNQGAAQHNVSIDEAGGTIVEAEGGETAEETVTLEPGTYRYYCSVPGHESLMNGELTVQ